jgi:hypothetical protein
VLHLAHIARHELGVPAINYVDAVRLLPAAGGAGSDGVARVLARAQRFRVHRGVAVALAMSLALGPVGDLQASLDVCGITSGFSRFGVLMASVREILADRRPPRALQLVRKALLVDGPRELLGLALVGIQGHLAHRFRPTPSSPPKL